MRFFNGRIWLLNPAPAIFAPIDPKPEIFMTFGNGWLALMTACAPDPELRKSSTLLLLALLKEFETLLDEGSVTCLALLSFSAALLML
jgi:hypothetical protein